MKHDECVKQVGGKHGSLTSSKSWIGVLFVCHRITNFKPADFSQTLDPDKGEQIQPVRIQCSTLKPLHRHTEQILNSVNRAPQARLKQSYKTSFHTALDAYMQSFGAHACTADITMLRFCGTSSVSGSDQTALLVFCLSPYTAGVFYWAGGDLLYSTFSPLAAAIRHRASDRLRLEVRTFHACATECVSNRWSLSEKFGF